MANSVEKVLGEIDVVTIIGKEGYEDIVTISPELDQVQGIISSVYLKKINRARMIKEDLQRSRITLFYYKNVK
jgi:hypothetical protein